MRKRARSKVRIKHTVVKSQNDTHVLMLLGILFITLVLWLVVALNSEAISSWWASSNVGITGNAVATTHITPAVTAPERCTLGQVCGPINVTSTGGVSPAQYNYYWRVYSANGTLYAPVNDSDSGFQMFYSAASGATINPTFKFPINIQKIILWVRFKDSGGTWSNWSNAPMINITNPSPFVTVTHPEVCYYGRGCDITISAPVANPFYYQIYLKVFNASGSGTRRIITTGEDWINMGSTPNNNQYPFSFSPDKKFINAQLWVITYKSILLGSNKNIAQSGWGPSLFTIPFNDAPTIPLCVASDWKNETSVVCNSSGKMIITWSLKTPGSCTLQGGYSPTQNPQTVNCNYVAPTPTCSAGTHLYGEVCVSNTCNGTAPQTIAGTVKGNSTFTSGAQKSWLYESTATNTTPCRWSCLTNYHDVTNSSFVGCEYGMGNCSTAPGCLNYSLANSDNVSEICDVGFQCYECKLGYTWSSTNQLCAATASSISWINTYGIDTAPLELGYTDFLGLNEAFEVIVADGNHWIGVVSITSSKAKINVSSKPQQVELEIGDEAKFDVDGDNQSDLRVKLNNIQAGLVNLTVWSIEQVVVPDLGTGDSDTNDDTVNDEEVVDDTVNDDETSGFKWFNILLVIMIIAVVLALIFVYLKKSGKLDQMMKKKSPGSASSPQSNMPPRPPFNPGTMMNPMNQPRPPFNPGAMNQPRPSISQNIPVPNFNQPRPGFPPR